MRLRFAASLLLLLLASAVHAGESASEQWQPSESWPGGKQYDARLDKTVQFWGAGLSLSDVCRGLEQQTGVKVEPFALDREALLRVTLFLNPDQPPALRELLVQLAWTLDASVATTGERNARVYRLLLPSASTNLMAEVTAALLHEDEESLRHGDEEKEARDSPIRQQAMARLLELQKALVLSQHDLIARYHGRDDSLLLGALDPRRRAGAEFVLSLPSEDLNHFVETGSLVKKMEALSAQQQVWARVLAGAEQLEPGAYLERVYASVRGEGELFVSWDVHHNELRSGPELRRAVISIDPKVTLPPDALELRKLVGEPVTPDVEARLWAEYEAARKLQGQQEARAREAGLKEADALRLERLPLSAGMRQTLSGGALPLDTAEGYALWQVQEATAKAFGVHIVSDYFWQPARNLQQGNWALSPGTQLNALQTLALHCLARAGRGSFAGDPDQWALGWEWGDMGQFLRFRSRERDIWRSSILPPGVVARLDTQLDAYLPKLGDPAGWGRSVSYRIVLEPFYWVMPCLNPEQARWGGKLGYEPPTQPLARERDALRRLILRLGMDGTSPFLATLSTEQWRLMRGEGLRVRNDLTAEQYALITKMAAEENQEGPAPDVSEAVIRLKPDAPTPDDVPPGPPFREVIMEQTDLECTQGARTLIGTCVAGAYQIQLDLPPYPAKAEGNPVGPDSSPPAS
jgi:hypothetical protein